MRIDRFTKTVLVAIAISLGIIALNPWVQPDRAHAGRAVEYLLAWPATEIWMDKRTGNVWDYTGLYASTSQLNQPKYLGTLTELGKPLIMKKELMKK